MMAEPKFTHCQEFMAWLESYNPDWELEYSGDIEGLFDAWEAGQLSMKQWEPVAHYDRHALCYTIDTKVDP